MCRVLWLVPIVLAFLVLILVIADCPAVVGTLEVGIQGLVTSDACL